MKTPAAGLLGITFLLWGFRAGGVLLPLSVIMALLYEAAPHLPWRMELEKKHFLRVADFCTVSVIVAVVIITLSMSPWLVIYVFASWLPALFFPLLLAHRLGNRRETLPLDVLFYALRGKKGEVGQFQPGALGFASLLLATGMAGTGAWWLLPIMTGLVAWYLWPHRPRRFPARVWLFSLVLALLTAWGVERGLVGLTEVVEEKGSEWLATWFAGESFDPFHSRTAMGEVGERKNSDRVVMQARVHPRAISTFLLREAVYDRYFFGNWSASSRQRVSIPFPKPGQPWSLAPTPPSERRMTIHRRFPKGKGLVGMPMGTHAIGNLLASGLFLTPLGTLQAEDVPGYAVYEARFSRDGVVESPPGESDRMVPANERSLLQEVVGQWGLEGKTAKEAMLLLTDRFRQDFRYSLDLKGGGVFGTPVGDFLLKDKAGHCEYFATATVMLLRQMGIPARYAVGFSMQEYLPGEDLYLIRSSHAHAWAMVHDGEKWVDLDTTPPDWGQSEEAKRDPWQPLLDLWDEFLFWLEVWREKEDRENMGLIFFIPPLFFWLAWRMRHVVWNQKKKVAIVPEEKPSPFQKVEAALSARHGPRPPGEPLLLWLERIGEHSALPLAEWHYKKRFDPSGLSPDQEERFRKGVEGWLAE